MIRQRVWNRRQKLDVPQYDPKKPPVARTKVGGQRFGEQPRMTRVVRGRPKPRRIITKIGT